MNQLSPILRECSRWGIGVKLLGRVDHVAKEKDHGIRFGAPMHFGGITEDESIVFEPRTWEREPGMDACALIHEMVHVIMWRRTDITPARHEELEMLALEAECWRRLRLSNGAWMRDYGVDGGEWPELSLVRRGRILATSRRYLTELGLMRDGKPTYEVKT